MIISTAQTTMNKPNPRLEQMIAREQLMEDIDSIVDEYFQSQITECGDLGEISNFQEARDCLIKELCDAVCKNYPTL